MRVFNLTFVLFLSLAVVAQAGCITVNRNNVSTRWSIVDKALERWVYRNYRRNVDFTCSEYGSNKALCMPDWMRNTPRIGGANPMTFCAVSVGTHRQVYLTDQKTVNRWIVAERASRSRARDTCPYKALLLREQKCGWRYKAKKNYLHKRQWK